MSKKDKRKFADIIIIICVVMSMAITISVLWEYHRLNVVMPSGVVATLLGLWGGELLIIALRQIFGSDVINKSTKTYEEGSI